MKRFFLFLLTALLLLPAVAVPGLADASNGSLEIYGFDIPYQIDNQGILKITFPEEMASQIQEKMREGLKSGRAFIEIDLTGFEHLKGFILSPSSWSAIRVKVFEDVELLIGPQCAMGIEDNSGGGKVRLEAAFHFAEDGQLSGMDLRLTSDLGYSIESIAVVSLPTEAYGLDLKNMVLFRDGEPIAGSCVLDGIFYAAVSLAGSYTVGEARPADFADEIPAWAKSAVDWMSARGVAEGYGGLFRPHDGITRAEFMTMFARLHNVRDGKPEGPSYQYQDLSEVPAWASIWMPPSLHFDAEPDGYLYPNRAMTCGELMSAVQRYIAICDIFYTPEGEQRIPFTGKEPEADSREPEVIRLSRAGIFSPGGGVADPDAVATRAQAAELLFRFAKWETFNRTYR